MATARVEVGVRDLKNNLSRYLDRVREGEDVIVTEHGRPVARLSALDHLAALIAAGVVRPPRSTARHRPRRRIAAEAPVSDLADDQRR
jgi:prevent-host-death family protein